MKRKKLTEKLWKAARLLSDAAEMAEELEECKRMASQSQGTCQRLVKELDEARVTIAAITGRLGGRSAGVRSITTARRSSLPCRRW